MLHLAHVLPQGFGLPDVGAAVDGEEGAGNIKAGGVCIGFLVELQLVNLLAECADGFGTLTTETDINLLGHMNVS